MTTKRETVWRSVAEITRNKKWRDIKKVLVVKDMSFTFTRLTWEFAPGLVITALAEMIEKHEVLTLDELKEML